MELHVAIRQIVDKFGKQILAEPRFISILMDYSAFQNCKAAKLIIETIIINGYMEKLLSLNFGDDSWIGRISSLRCSIIDSYAFREDVLDYILKCIVCTSEYISSNSLITKNGDLILDIQSAIRSNEDERPIELLFDNASVDSFITKATYLFKKLNPKDEDIVKFCKMIGFPALQQGSLKDYGEFMLSNDGKVTHRHNRSKIIVPEGVEEIGEGTFENCYFITEVVLPNSIKIIRKNAFCNCQYLEKINLPESLEIIEYSAFSSCYRLTQIKLPLSLKKIGNSVFHCAGLKELYLHKNISEFSGVIPCNVVVDVSNKCYSSEDGFLLSKDKKILLAAPSHSKGTLYIPNSVEIIGESAFFCCRLDNVVLPEKLHIIHKNAFCNTELKSLTIPKSVKKIESYIVSSCKELTEIFFEHDNLTNIDADNLAFDNFDCSKCTLHFRKELTCEASNIICFRGFKEIKAYEPPQRKKVFGLLDFEPIPRRILNILILVDNTITMGGNKIGAINDSIQNTLPLIKEEADRNPDIDVRINILPLSHNETWMYNNPVTIDSFIYKPLVANGRNFFGKACVELNNKLNRKNGFMQSNDGCGYFAPAILLVMGSYPADDYKPSLEKLKTNGWFKNAAKLAFDMSVTSKHLLADFTGTQEAVVSTNFSEVFKNFFRLNTHIVS